MLYGNSVVTGVEKHFSNDELVVTKTDLKGKITYANRVFYRLSGTTAATALGAPQNIIRHPEMPRTIFKFLWDEIQKGEEVFAYINNRSLNGDHYWVFAHVTSSRDLSGNINGYHSNRRKPSQSIINQKILPLYSELMRLEKSAASPREGLRKAEEYLQKLLKEKGADFNEMMFAFGH